MNAEEIQVGKWYRGKRFLSNPIYGSNDRIVVWISTDRKKIQYDSDTVHIGRHLPMITMEKFLKWAKQEAPKAEVTP